MTNLHLSKKVWICIFQNITSKISLLKLELFTFLLSYGKLAYLFPFIIKTTTTYKHTAKTSDTGGLCKKAITSWLFLFKEICLQLEYTVTYIPSNTVFPFKKKCRNIPRKAGINDWRSVSWQFWLFKICMNCSDKTLAQTLW